MYIIDEWERDGNIFQLKTDDEDKDTGYITETDPVTGAYIVYGDYLL